MEHSPLNELNATGYNNTSGLRLLNDLLRGKYVPHGQWRKVVFRAKYAVRTLIYPVQTLNVLANIAADPLWQKAFSVQTTLAEKVHKPYLYLGLPASQRCATLLSHYNFVENIANSAVRNAFLSQTGDVVAAFSGKEGEMFTLRLGSLGKSEREGEATLFFDMDDIRLAALTFSVTSRPAGRALVIGGLQGAHRDTPHETIKLATKACYGLFPKRMLIECLQLMAGQWGIKRILAVNDRSHIFRSLRYRHRKRTVFLASYNEFWDSISATPYSSSLYDVPLSLPRKGIEDIASKKRSEYRKRYLLLDDLARQLSALI
ncbi:VirK/YbjX family protein [Sodalis sp. RH21]|uniref:VirK/YbjX family protein n=1 Tax=unclassified Sodalis (in: enterobacteria) TaxID=2636512 RepID=UPI0039B3B262